MRWAKLQYEAAIGTGVDFAADGLAEAAAPGLLRYIRTTDIVSQQQLRDDGVYVQAEQVPKAARARNGDLLFTRAGSVGTSYLHRGDEAAFAGYLICCRLRPEHDPRFFGYWAQSQPFWDAVRVGAVRSTIDNFSGRKYAELSVPLPPAEAQRRVADYLDTETARIDRMLAQNNELTRLGAERWRATVEQRLAAVGPMVQLQYLSELTPGYAYPSGEFEEGGHFRLLRGVNVGTGSLRWDEVVFGSSSLVESTAEYALRAGDLVFGMDRPWISSGLRAARIDEKDLPCYLVQRVLRIRPHADRLDADFLLLWLQTRQFFSDFEPEMTGISVPHVSSGQVGAARVPLPPVDLQRQVADELNEDRLAWSRVEAAVGRQSALLRERRQALITSAVTGELEV